VVADISIQRDVAETHLAATVNDAGAGSSVGGTTDAEEPQLAAAVASASSRTLSGTRTDHLAHRGVDGGAVK
jgi:hypothetical protein